MRLSEKEIQEIFTSLKEGRSLDIVYREKLFETNHKCELIWDGKEAKEEKLISDFKILEDFIYTQNICDSNKVVKTELVNSDYLLEDWSNKLIHGDNKLILASLKKGKLRDQVNKIGGIKLIYIDPPFDVGTDFKMDLTIDSEASSESLETISQIAYHDSWGSQEESYLSMIYERIKIAYSLLHDDGFMFVHCDYRIDAYLRLIMDELFGKSCFVNQIIWRRKGGSALKGMACLSNAHDIILCYSKKQGTRINSIYSDASSEYINKQFKYKDPDGRAYMVNVMRSPSPRPNLKYNYKGYKTPPNGWSVPRKTMDKLDAEGRLHYPESKNKQIYKKIYLDEYPGQLINTLWTNIPALKGNNKEILGYPTQKPEALLERIIKIGSRPGDLVFDFFCGSGTTCAVAEKLGRKWIGADNGQLAIHITKKRLLDLRSYSSQLNSQKTYFQLLTLGNDEKQYFIDKLECSSEDEQPKSKKGENFQRLVLRTYKAKPINGFTLISGKKSDKYVAIWKTSKRCPWSFIKDVIHEAISESITKVEILSFDYDFGLLNIAEELAKEEGIDLSLKYIPRDIFNANAIKKENLTFYNSSFLKIKTSIRDGQAVITMQNYSISKSNPTEEAKPDFRQWVDIIDYWSVGFMCKRLQQFAVDKNNVGDQFNSCRDLLFENHWQSYRTSSRKIICLTTPPLQIPENAKYMVAKARDLFGNESIKVHKF